MSNLDVVVYGKDGEWYRVLAFDPRGNVAAYLAIPDDPGDEGLQEFRRVGIDPLLCWAKDTAIELAAKHRISSVRHLSPWPFEARQGGPPVIVLE